MSDNSELRIEQRHEDFAEELYEAERSHQGRDYIRWRHLSDTTRAAWIRIAVRAFVRFEARDTAPAEAELGHILALADNLERIRSEAERNDWAGGAYYHTRISRVILDNWSVIIATLRATPRADELDPPPSKSEREAALLDALKWWSDHVDKPHSMAEFNAAVEKTRALLTALASQDAPSAPSADGLDPHTLEAAAKKATSFLVGDPSNGIPLRSPMPHEIAAAIRALLKERPK